MSALRVDIYTKPAVSRQGPGTDWADLYADCVARLYGQGALGLASCTPGATYGSAALVHWLNECMVVDLPLAFFIYDSCQLSAVSRQL